MIQPEWRWTGEDPPQGSSTWSYVLSGGSKGAFLIILCLAWWDRAYTRSLEEKGAAGGVNTNIPHHDPEWLKVVEDVAFVMEKARGCKVPTRGVPSTDRTAKRKRETEPADSRKKATRSKV